MLAAKSYRPTIEHWKQNPSKTLAFYLLYCLSHTCRKNNSNSQWVCGCSATEQMQRNLGWQRRVWKGLLALPQLFTEAELENCPYRRCFSTRMLFHQYMLHVSKLYWFTLQNVSNYITFYINIVNYRPSLHNLQSIIIINAVEKTLNSPIWVIHKFFERLVFQDIFSIQIAIYFSLFPFICKSLSLLSSYPAWDTIFILPLSATVATAYISHS